MKRLKHPVRFLFCWIDDLNGKWSLLMLCRHHTLNVLQIPSRHLQLCLWQVSIAVNGTGCKASMLEISRHRYFCCKAMPTLQCVKLNLLPILALNGINRQMGSGKKTTAYFQHLCKIILLACIHADRWRYTSCKMRGEMKMGGSCLEGSWGSIFKTAMSGDKVKERFFYRERQ